MIPVIIVPAQLGPTPIKEKHMTLTPRKTVLAGAAAILLTGGMFSTASAATVSASNEFDANGQESTPVVTDFIHDNEDTFDIGLGVINGATGGDLDTHEDVEPLTCR
jgi:hypothetical protein